jgi:protein SCO1/2
VPRPVRLRLVLAALAASAALALVLVAVLVLGGGDDTADATPAEAAQGAVPGQGFAGGIVTPRRTAPAIALTDVTGERVSLAALRGKAVFVTFLYTNCPDVCPLTTDHLRTALDDLPPATRRKVGIIAVSVDPKGDTRPAVRRFLARHRMTGRMSYVVGSAAALKPTWKAWGVGAVDDPGSRFVSHSALIYGVDAAGRLTTAYPWDVAPADIVKDAPKLVAAT